MRISKSLSLLIFSILIFAVSAEADSWALPEERTTCSENNKFCFKVIPKKLESQLSYFRDKVDEKEDAGADKKAKKNYCKGIFYVRDSDGFLREKWKTKLVNEVSPVTVLVSNNGDYVVTFDNWHSVGYGGDTVVIYETSKGNVIKTLGLSDFLTDNDISNLPTSTSSIWWGGKHFVDKEKAQLVLKVTKGKQSSEKNVEYFDVRIEISTGKVLDEKRDRLPSLQFLIDLVQATQQNEEAEISKDAKENECFQGKTFERFSSSDFLQRVIKKELPVYSVAAKAVRASGRVVVEALVNESGAVACVRTVSGHPLLRHSARNALKSWTFEKSDTSYIGRIAFEAKSVWVSPDGKVID